jgi:rod shape-determining protein MreC
MPVERSQKDVWKLTPWLMLVLLFGNFVLMAYDARAENRERVVRVWAQAAANFVQSPVTYASTSIKGFFESVVNLRSAQTENDVLKQQVQKLEIEVQKSKQLTDDNTRLKDLLEFKNQSEITILTAQIIGRDTSAWFDSAIIDRGSLDGVKLNMPIVVDGGLIGRVTAVSPLTAQIDLITRDKAALGAIVGKTSESNALGVVRGSGNKDQLEMDYVPGYMTVTKGDIVYTTGQGGVYPAGLRIGVVENVRTGSATVPHQIFIKPSAQVSSMQEVAVLLYTPPERPKYEEALPNAVSDDEKVVK